MKLTIAATGLASSIIATAESLPKPAGESLRDVVVDTPLVSHRSLAVSMKDQHETSAIFKERRASKKQNGRVIRNLQNKLNNSKLRNRGEEDGEMSDSELDLGFFSRNLQNVTEPEEENVIEELVALCSAENPIPGITCDCTNVDVDAYTANVFCTYDETCLDPTSNSCNETLTFCFVETYELEVFAPGSGTSSICYDVNSPITFSYCYGLSYSGEEGSPSGCFLEVDGNQCNSCEFTVESDDLDVTCNAFDCTNVDDAIGSGIACGEDTIVSKKIEDFLIYAPLPCEGYCNICPFGGEMTNLDNTVTMELTGQAYYCYELNLAGLMGYLQNIPGDLCNTLPAMVSEPCGCPGTSPPVVPIFEEPDTVTSDEVDEALGDIEIPVENEPLDEAPESAAACSSNDGFTIAAVMAFIFSHVM